MSAYRGGHGRAPVEAVPWAWAINGWASVAGGVVMTFSARLVGYSFSLGLALSAYGVALAIVLAAELLASWSRDDARAPARRRDRPFTPALGMRRRTAPVRPTARNRPVGGEARAPSSK